MLLFRRLKFDSAVDFFPSPLYLINLMVKPSSKTIRSKSEIDLSTERRIFAAAREEFIERGLRGARMQAIADRAAVNKALVHYYFRTKERLYDAVLQDTLATILGAVRGQLPGNEPDNDLRSLLRRIVTIYITTLKNNPDFPRFIIRELADGGEHLPRLIDAAIALCGDIPRRIYGLFVAETEQGTVRPIKPVHFLLNMLGMCAFTFIARPVLSLISDRAGFGVTFDDAFFQDRIDAIIDWTCCGIFTEARP